MDKHTKYIQLRDRVVQAFEGFDDNFSADTPINTAEKILKRSQLLSYLIEMFGSWKKNGDCLPIPFIPMGRQRLYLSFEDIADLKDKLHRRNMQIKDLKKVISTTIEWCQNTADALSQLRADHPNYAKLQAQIGVYKDTIKAIKEFQSNR